MNIGSYQLIERISTTAGGELHLVRHVQDGTSVLLKLLARDSAAEGLRLKHEYTLLQSLDVPEILHPRALFEDGARLALVMEPFAGESLDAVLARQARRGYFIAGKFDQYQRDIPYATLAQAFDRLVFIKSEKTFYSAASLSFSSTQGSGALGY